MTLRIHLSRVTADRPPDVKIVQSAEYYDDKSRGHWFD